MWVSICLTLMATAGNNIGKVLQKKGTVALPPLSLKFKVLKAYIFNKSWIIGFVMDMLGAVLMLKALSLAPVSIIQPVSGCGLAILAIFSHFYLREVMNALDWIAIVLAGIGTIGVGVGGEEQTVTVVSLLRLPWLVVSISVLFVLLNSWLRIYKSKRREQELINYEVVEEIISGLESGILFGLASVISKLGFVFSNQGFPEILVPFCISISIGCSAVGFVCQTRGLKHGRAIVVSTCTAVASIVTGVLAGMFALGESLPSASGARFSLLLDGKIHAKACSCLSGDSKQLTRSFLVQNLLQVVHHFWCHSSRVLDANHVFCSQAIAAPSKKRSWEQSEP
ncbi:hypothetical protein HPP92_007483 [Vanilla planifolia]|uniref:Probable magnesium transporter n=1 Tax=Vanilla planifolia TaxID=51239 RepID=A0A835RLW6_VANPL|nr:hypothetical protein HPP92_007483 [Vanilla planifolia]